MPHTIEDIIRECQSRYSLEITEKNKFVYIGFLKRQLKENLEYDLDYMVKNINPKKAFPYFNSMIDKLLLFSYLIGETDIISGTQGNTEIRRIRTIGDLYLLSMKESGYHTAIKRQTDHRLFKLIGRISNRLYLIGGWAGHINELGMDREVIKYFGQRTDYSMVRGNKHKRKVA